METPSTVSQQPPSSPSPGTTVPQQAPAPRTAATLAEARNLVDLLLQNGLTPSRVAAKQKLAGQWRDVTWGEIVEKTRKLSEGLIDLGVATGDRVCIFSATRLDWTIADFAIMGAGAISVPIYASNTPQEIEHIVNDSGAKVVIFDHDVPEAKASGRWSRLSSVRSHMPKVEHYVAMDLPSDPGRGYLGFAELETRGARRLREDPYGLEQRAGRIAAEDLCSILYTSGTTGLPKGVMLTHGNWTYQAKAVVEVGLLARADTALLFLPLAHSFARVVEAAWLGQGFTLAFAEAIEKAVDNAAEVGATVMPAVPRVFEKAYTKVISDGHGQPGVKGRLFGWAMDQFDEYAAAKMAGREYDTVQWLLARRLVFAKIEQRLKTRFGGKMRLFISGGAPLPRKVAYFFELCGLAILEGYGLTETSAPTHANRLGKIRVGSVGQPFPDVEVRFAEDGEILVRGPQVMKGYYNRPADTAEVLEPDGWFHTGDIGEADPEGYLRITDRKKDLIKTSGGKYIAPQELENALKAEPLVGNVCVIGDRRRYVAAVITISEEHALKWARDTGLPVSDAASIAHRPELRARIQAAVNAVNENLPSYATIKRFAILDHEWSQATGELTPKLSVKRKVVLDKYKSVIDGLYDGEKLE